MKFDEAKSTFEAITKIVKGAANLNLEENIVDLREYVISLKDDNILLMEENQDLKLRLETQQDFSLKNGLCWKDGDDVPFCQKCLEGSRKAIHLQRWGTGSWKCFECDKYYSPPGGAAIISPSKRRNPGI